MSTMSQISSFTPRNGQQSLIEYLPGIKSGNRLSVQWPTGYGKSIGFALAWKHCKESGIANRLLLVVANDTQRQQIINDFTGDCKVVGAPCEGGVWAFERSAGDIRSAMEGVAEVFVCTVQQLYASGRGGVNTLKDMLTTRSTKWMIGFDEFHHYGEDMAWGDAAKLAMQHAQFTLAMSATPYRRGADTIFCESELVVTYLEAVQEKAVKTMLCHSYDYKVTVIDSDGEASNYTTGQLIEMAPDGIDTWEERKNIRYSPQYLQPLIIHPLTRLAEKRAASGGVRLQCLIRAMSCTHAKALCEQVKTLSGDFTVDWIGTGYNGRSDEENRRILAAFCPPKTAGKRPQPTLDVLVQVSMAGEGFDSINVCEIVDLFPVSGKAANGRATRDKQFYGRGARMIPNTDAVQCHVNVPSDHPLHCLGGETLHRYMDACDEKAEGLCPVPPTQQEQDLFKFPELPKQREIELLNITTEDPHFIEFAEKCAKSRGYSTDSKDDVMELLGLYRCVGKIAAQQDSIQARSSQVSDYINGIVSRVALVMAKKSDEMSGAVIGRFKKEVNKMLIRRYGKTRDQMLLSELEQAATWLKSYLEGLK